MIAVDLGCGLGGWARGFVDLGFIVHGYDIIDFSKQYPGIFHRCDLMECDIEQIPRPDVVLASPPCTEFTKASMPRSWYPHPDIDGGLKIFNRFREITSLLKPKFYVIENVRGAQKYVGRADFHIGSRYFWSNVEPFTVVADDIYGKSKVTHNKMRPWIRSMIPYSISRAFAEKIWRDLNEER